MTRFAGPAYTPNPVRYLRGLLLGRLARQYQVLGQDDEAVKRDGAEAQDESKRQSLLEAMELLSQSEHPEANRAEQLLVHFAKIS